MLLRYLQNHLTNLCSQQRNCYLKFVVSQQHLTAIMNNSTRGGRNRSVSVVFGNFSKPVMLHRRSQSSLIGLIHRSVRVVVLGVGGVGKTAMIVRFVTKRFIGDYDPTLETIYRHTATINDQLVHFEIMDTAGQEENSVMLEDKCKWGESFIFVYDVTDKYSFDELTRLKFVASYTHDKMRVNYKPCWILIGNKTDLAKHDRMVTTEEGMALARDLGCHMFREISVKESTSDASEVFEDLWRDFSRLSPRSPSTSQRRKNSCKIQDKISVLDSEACTCTSEVLRSIHNSSNNPSIVSSLTSVLKRQASVPSLYHAVTRSAKDGGYSDSNNNDERFDGCRISSKFAEDREGISDIRASFKTPQNKRKHSRRHGLTSNAFENKFSSFPSLSQAESVCSDVNGAASSDRNTSSTVFTSSSRSSSNSSLNGSSSCPSESGLKIKPLESPIYRPDLDTSPLRNSDSHSSDDLVTQYREHCLRHRARKSVTCYSPLSCPLNSY